MQVGIVYGPVGHIEQEPGEPPKLVFHTTRWHEVQAIINQAIETGKAIPCRDRKAHKADELDSISLVLQTLSQGELSAVITAQGND